ncbi:MAG: hypothetical protein FWC70_11725 [Defluviitaleaceae bacterium]|nr:hypothetical protein [Defluviitaleaceae bacterium]
MTFWDFCAPFYDFAEKNNGIAYGQMLQAVHRLVPQGSTVLEVAAGTGSIGLAASARFLPEIGFDNCEIIHIPGKMPMAVAVWAKD